MARSRRRHLRCVLLLALVGFPTLSLSATLFGPAFSKTCSPSRNDSPARIYQQWKSVVRYGFKTRLNSRSRSLHGTQSSPTISISVQALGVKVCYSVLSDLLHVSHASNLYVEVTDRSTLDSSPHLMKKLSRSLRSVLP
ncbi:unnamed protein product [Cochlearia groenlandica]